MKLKPDGRMIEASPEEQAQIAKAFEELQWHVSNMMVLLGSVQDNEYLTKVYSFCVREVVEAYEESIRAGIATSYYRYPIYREQAEDMLRLVFGIDYEILPRTKVRGCIAGNGVHEMEVKP